MVWFQATVNNSISVCRNLLADDPETLSQFDKILAESDWSEFEPNVASVPGRRGRDEAAAELTWLREFLGKIASRKVRTGPAAPGAPIFVEYKKALDSKSSHVDTENEIEKPSSTDAVEEKDTIASDNDASQTTDERVEEAVEAKGVSKPVNDVPETSYERAEETVEENDKSASDEPANDVPETSDEGAEKAVEENDKSASDEPANDVPETSYERDEETVEENDESASDEPAYDAPETTNEHAEDTGREDTTETTLTTIVRDSPEKQAEKQRNLSSNRVAPVGIKPRGNRRQNKVNPRSADQQIIAQARAEFEAIHRKRKRHASFEDWKVPKRKRRFTGQWTEEKVEPRHPEKAPRNSRKQIIPEAATKRKAVPEDQKTATRVEPEAPRKSERLRKQAKKSPAEKDQVWCICQKPQHGPMVACDNNDCQYQWFHIGCIGLKRLPTRPAWLCQWCRKAKLVGKKTEDVDVTAANPAESRQTNKMDNSSNKRVTDKRATSKQAVIEAAAKKKAVDEPVADELAANKAESSKSAAAKPAAKRIARSAPYTPAANRSASNKRAANKRAAIKRAATQRAATKRTTTKPTANKVVATKPTANKAAATKSTANKAAATKPSANKAAANKAAAKKVAKPANSSVENNDKATPELAKIIEWRLRRGLRQRPTVDYSDTLI